MRQESREGAGPAGDQVRFGSSREPRPHHQVAGYLAVVVVIAASVAVAITTRGHAQSGAAGRGSPADQWYAVSGTVAVKAVGHPLLGQHPGWELLAAGTGAEPGSGGTAVLVRIQFAAGQITRTRLPLLQSNGPVFLIAGPGQVIFRPLDNVAGYLVPDNKPARELPAALGEGGVVYPGPRPGQLWIPARSGAQPALRLVAMNGTAAGQSIRQLPSDGVISAPDGQGYVLVQLDNAAYDARPAGTRRVAAGTVTGVGSSGWLVSRCQGATRCVNTVIDPATGIGRILPGSADLTGYPVEGSWPPGLISPDGRLAAVVSSGPDNRPAMNLIDLLTGTDRVIALPHGAGGGPGLAWSPDSRWLFSVTSNGAIQVIDPATDQVRGIGVSLPPVTYLTISQAG